jgi:hypothetical protein
MHPPLQQFGAAERQPFPHEPQFAMLVVRFTHLLPHLVCPGTSQVFSVEEVEVGSTCASTHWPAEQVLVDGQLYPHRPQFDLSTCSS